MTEKMPIIHQYIQRYQGQILAALPPSTGMTLERFKRTAVSLTRTTPKLLECDPRSVFGCIVTAASLGLELGSALGAAYVLPYGKTAQLIIGYRGQIQLARRSGQVASIQARVVRKSDDFHYELGTNEQIHHLPGNGDGEVTHVYAVAKLAGGGTQFEVMTVAEVEEIRKKSRAGNTGPWVEYWDEMAKKTVTRRLFKYLPVSVDVQEAVGLDEQADAGVQNLGNVIEGEFEIEPEAQVKATPAEKVARAKRQPEPQWEDEPKVMKQKVEPPPVPLQQRMLDQLALAETSREVAATMRLINGLDDEERPVVYRAAEEAADRITAAQE